MTSAKFSVHVADETHCQDLERLIRELAEYERMSNGPQLNVQHLQRDLKENRFKAFVAILNEQYDSLPANTVVGYVIYYYAYSTWEGQYLFIEDIYVKPELRRLGIGQALWNRAAKHAYEKGFPRIEFDVLAWNETAIQFYKKMGSINLYERDSWMRFRLDKDCIEKLVKC